MRIRLVLLSDARNVEIDSFIERYSVMKRWVIQLLMCVVLGLILNFVVAWGCALWATPHQSGLINGPVLEQFIFTPYQQQQLDNVKPISKLTGLGVEVLDAIAMTAQAPVGVRTVEAGYPCHSLTGMQINSTINLGVIERQLFSPRSLQLVKLIPLRPLWPGFAINTIFYAAMLWVVFFVPGKVKRTLRRRRGQCPACAYPVGTSSVCTECGVAIRRDAISFGEQK